MTSGGRQKEIAIEDLIDLASPTDVKISPTGKHAVYVLKPGCKRGEHETSALWIAELDKEKSARPLTSGLSEDRSPLWLADGRSVAFVSDRAKAGKSSVIYTISLDGGEANPLTPVENEQTISGLQLSPNGKFIVYRSPDEKSSENKRRDEEKDDAIVYGQDWTFARLRIVHIATRSVETVVAVDLHVLAFACSPKTKEICYATSRTPELDSPARHGVQLHMFDTLTKETQKISDFPGSVSNLVWPTVPDSRSVYFLAKYTPSSTCSSSVPYRLDLDDNKWTRSGTIDDASSLSLIKDTELPDSHALAFLHLDLLDAFKLLKHDGSKLALDYSFSFTAFDAIVTGGDDGKAKFAAVKSEPGKPPELFSTTIDLYTGRPKYGDWIALSNHASESRIVGLCSGRDLLSTSQLDNTPLDAVFLHPTTFQTGAPPLPTVVLIHGGPYDRSTLSFDPAQVYKCAPMLAAAGYGVLCPNYRGGIGHGNKFAADAAGGMGKNDFADIMDIVNTAIKEGLADKDRLVVAGWSQGGFLSYLSAVRETPFRGAICGAGVTDWDMLTMTSDLTAFEADLSGAAPWETKDGAKDVAARHGSAIWQMQHTKKGDRTPVLILHGEKDERVPLTQASAFHRACLDLGWPCEFVRYPREGHRITERNHQIDMLKRVRRFCDFHVS